jgi:predicted DNA-binding transcriptional regulator AlpA
VRGTTSAQRAHQLTAVSDGHEQSMSGNEVIMKAPAGLDVPELLTTAEVAALLKVNRSTLSRWRSVGIGPRVTWLTANIPRYQRADVVEWLRRAVA